MQWRNTCISVKWLYLENYNVFLKLQLWGKFIIKYFMYTSPKSKVNKWSCHNSENNLVGVSFIRKQEQQCFNKKSKLKHSGFSTYETWNFNANIAASVYKVKNLKNNVKSSLIINIQQTNHGLCLAWHKFQKAYQFYYLKYMQAI